MTVIITLAELVDASSVLPEIAARHNLVCFRTRLKDNLQWKAKGKERDCQALIAELEAKKVAFTASFLN